MVASINTGRGTGVLRCAGPMQSWGGAGTISVDRPSLPMPTLSGIAGILAAALGIGRDADLSFAQDLMLGVRADRPGHWMQDFQTARPLPGERIVALTGKERIATDPIVMRKGYLSDAVFLVAIQGDAGWIEEAMDALRHPVYPLYLGRRSCPPSQPLVLGATDDAPDEIIHRFPWIGNPITDLAALWANYGQQSDEPSHSFQLPGPLRAELSVPTSNAPNIAQRNDVPICWADDTRRYGWRSVKCLTIMPATVPEHDPFALLG